MEFLDALPEPLLGWHLYDAVVQAVTRRCGPASLPCLPLPPPSPRAHAPPRSHRPPPSPRPLRDLIEDPGTRLRNLRLLLGEIPPSHKPLLCKITRMAQRLLQGTSSTSPPCSANWPSHPSRSPEPSNGLTSQVLAEAFAHGVVRTPYLPQALSSRLEISRLLQNKEEVIVTQVRPSPPLLLTLVCRDSLPPLPPRSSSSTDPIFSWTWTPSKSGTHASWS